MSTGQILVSVALGLLVNELCEVSPWAARCLVRWAAHTRYCGTDRAETRAEEWAAVINDRPSSLLKLITALFFAGAALAHKAVPARRKTTLPWFRVSPALRLVLIRAGATFALSSGAVYVVFSNTTQEWVEFFVEGSQGFVTTGIKIDFPSVLIVGFVAALGVAALSLSGIPSGVASGTLYSLFFGGLSLLQVPSVQELRFLVFYFGVASISFGAGVSLAVALLVRRGVMGKTVYVLTNVVAQTLLYAGLIDSFDTNGGAMGIFTLGLVAGLGIAVGRWGLHRKPTPAAAPVKHQS